jgi:hypothetical protein
MARMVRKLEHFQKMHRFIDVHLDQGFLDRALAPPITLDDRRLEGLRPQLRYPQLDLAGLGLQFAFVMPGPRIAASLSALVTLRIAQPIRLGV